MFISLAPVFIILLYVYLRDKYEREPLDFLLKAVFGGMLIAFPIYFIEKSLTPISLNFSNTAKAAFDAFIIAS
ncbi:MAG: hypothetical protein V1783_10450, partial [Bacteroidota bacterium]